VELIEWASWKRLIFRKRNWQSQHIRRWKGRAQIWWKQLHEIFLWHQKPVRTRFSSKQEPLGYSHKLRGTTNMWHASVSFHFVFAKVYHSRRVSKQSTRIRNICWRFAKWSKFKHWHSAWRASGFKRKKIEWIRTFRWSNWSDWQWKSRTDAHVHPHGRPHYIGAQRILLE